MTCLMWHGEERPFRGTEIKKQNKKQGLIRKGEGEKEGIFYYRQETHLLEK